MNASRPTPPPRRSVPALRLFRAAPLLLPLILAGRPAAAQTAAIDSLLGFATAETPGCAVGVSRNGRVVVERGYGLADVGRGIPVTANTVFDIGSVQKQFVAAAVLLLAEDGRLSLSDDIRRHLPELPDYGHAVTVDHLLTHTGGVRDWTGLLPLAPEGTEVLPLIARQRALNFAPGTEWSYSNSGYVLLREIVARTSGTSFADFARRRIFEPLGMRSSAYVEDVLQAEGERALAYRREGERWTEFMRLGSRRGGGAIVSTAGDLLRWNQALTEGRLGAFVTGKLQERATLANGRTLTYARGLMVDADVPGGPMISHSGGAAGYSTWLGRFPAHSLSLAVLCNFEPMSTTALAGRIADRFLPPVDTAPEPAGPIAAEGVEVAGRAGVYFDARTGEPLRLVAEDGRLAIANGPPLVPVAADRFRPRRRSLFLRSEDDFEVRFPSDDVLEVASMEGAVTRYRRARPWTPAAAELRGVDGRYGSAELGSVFELVPGPSGVVLRFEHAPGQSVTLAPVDRDTWMQRMMFVRLVRDASGAAVGFDYGNPVIRSIRFTRLGDRAAPAASAETAAELPAEPVPPLASLVGTYEMAPGRTVTVTLEDGRLHGEPSGNPKRALTHVSGTTFSVDETPITLTFTLGSDGRATAAVMRQGGNERTLRRLP